MSCARKKIVYTSDYPVFEHTKLVCTVNITRAVLYANEEEEKREMFHEMQAEIRTLQNDVEKAKTTNKELIHYTEHLQRAPQDYKGKDIYSSKEKVKDFEDCHDKSSDSTVVC